MWVFFGMCMFARAVATYINGKNISVTMGVNTENFEILRELRHTHTHAKQTQCKRLCSLLALLLTTFNNRASIIYAR